MGGSIQFVIPRTDAGIPYIHILLGKLQES